MEQCKDRGNIPGKLYEAIKKLIKIEIPWYKLLEDCIKTYTNINTGSRSWRIPNKRFMSYGITLPGKRPYDLAPNTLIITVDSSASITSRNLRQFAYVIHENFKYFKKIIVMVHDVDVYNIEEFADSTQFLQFIQEVGFKGRGGTSHRLVFNEIEKRMQDDFDEVSLIISLTDNYSDIQYCYEDYSFWKSIPYVILTNDAILEELPKQIKQIKISD